MSSSSSESVLTTQELQTLASKAIAAKATAYCKSAATHASHRVSSFVATALCTVWFLSVSKGPYSKFRVGACILTQSGEYIVGANVENAAYPVGTCAERVAFGTAVVSCELRQHPCELHGTSPLTQDDRCRSLDIMTSKLLLSLPTVTFQRPRAACADSCKFEPSSSCYFLLHFSVFGRLA